MASTGTYSFGPAASNLTLTAFSRIKIRRAEITSQHMADADTEANLLQVEMGNRVPNLWRQEIYSISLTESDADYDLPARMVGIRDAYLTTTSGGVSTDRVVWPLSAAEYDAQPNKTLEAPPQSYYVQKSITPTITLWPVPDGAATYTLKLRLMTQIQDVSQKSGTTLDMPYRWLDVYVAGLAYRLSRIYATELEAVREKDFEKAWANAATLDVEDNTAVYISPSFGGYWR